MPKKDFYSLKNILKTNALYYVIFGGRSNGKTYAVHEYAIKRYIATGEQLAIIRRWSDDFTGKRGRTLFENQVSTRNVEKLTGGLWTDIYYYSSCWYLCTYDDAGERITDKTPFAYGFSISAMEHDKSSSYPNITTVLFDEFLTRTFYLDDEFVLFMNVLSTIIRHRTNVKIFMCGNTVNKYCPYFAEMGLTHIKEMQPGTIDIYRYGDSRLIVAVEYTDNRVSKESEMYFAFDNPKLSMITGSEWEIDVYPHLPQKYKPADIALTYFIEFNGELLQCEIVRLPNMAFTFIHRKTTPIKHPEKDIVYTTEYNPKSNYRRKINNPLSQTDKIIFYFFQADKVFYSDNEVGEIVRNYLQFCGVKM